jgi:hypothetical protein
MPRPTYTIHFRAERAPGASKGGGQAFGWGRVLCQARPAQAAPHALRLSGGGGRSRVMRTIEPIAGDVGSE